MRWAEDKTEEVRRRANDTIRSIYAEASQRADRSERQQMADHARRSENVGRLNAMVELARSLEGIPIAHDSLDGDPWLLNVTNGLVDLRTGELRPHDPRVLTSKLAPIDFDPAAECPTWLSFLDKVMGGNQEMVNFLQRAVGYSLTGVISEQCLFFLHGRGSNGKSTFVETVSTLLGEYWTKTPTETLMSKTHPGISNDVARLVGARLVTAQETEQGRKLAESLIKDLTGGDTVAARFLHQEFFQFKPQFKLWMYGNHKPVIAGTDEGIWRRIRLVPFTVTIPDEEKDRNLPAKLLEELPGILNWAIAGCLAWQSEGLGIPLEVAEATTTYRSEMDPLSDFISEYVVEGPQMTVKASVLYNAYKTWCSASGETYVSLREFGDKMRGRGYEAKKSGGKGTFWQRIGLKDEHRNIPEHIGTRFEDMLN